MSDVVMRYADRLLPRYTSYPTAPHFKAEIGPDNYAQWLTALPKDHTLSLYFHVPFCRSMCWYCGCHTTVTKRDEPIARYIEALKAEIDLTAGHLASGPGGGPGSARTVSHIHFGGGTPTLMKPEQFIDLMAHMRRRFAIAADAEIAIEIDPRTLTPEMCAALAEGGVTRASLGVQSFDARVQHAINRVQSYEETKQAAHNLRRAGILALNMDLLYGLPGQTVLSCIETTQKVLRLAPDRLAVFGYAHVPGFKPHQRKIADADLPDGEARHMQAEYIAAVLQTAGYQRIGLDHYARTSDPLAVAARNGTLHRNFQGYTTDDAQALIGFGASSIGRLPGGFVQNAVGIGDYLRAVETGELATAKGYALTKEDRLRAAIIERVMCDYTVDLETICKRFGVSPDDVLAHSTPMLDTLVADGIAERSRYTIRVQNKARPLVRAVAAAFDQYLGQSQARHARAV